MKEFDNSFTNYLCVLENAHNGGNHEVYVRQINYI